MRNVLGYFILSIVSFMFYFNVYADDLVCDYKDKADLIKYAFNVTADYEFVEESDGKTYFDISIYNIVENIYINYKTSNDKIYEAGTNVNYNQTDGGSYKFRILVPEKTYSYNFKVYGTQGGCVGELRNFSLAIPIRNDFFDTENCKRNGMEDFYYCKEWIIQEFSLSHSEIENKIEQKLESLKSKTTTKCLNCDNKVDNRKELLFKKIKLIVIVVLIILAVVDFIYMIFKLMDIRRSRI